MITTGDLNSDTHSIDVQAIESVGLQGLLGIWRTQQWQVFEFRDFNRLNLYSSTQSPPSSVGLEKTARILVRASPRFTESIFYSPERR